MGIGVSDWRLARAVSIRGQLGVVSSTAIDVVLARTLQMGDRDGYVRRAMQHFPFEEIAGAFGTSTSFLGGRCRINRSSRCHSIRSNLPGDWLGFAPKIMGADKNYHSEKFVSGCRKRGVKPHVAQVNGRKVEGLDGRTSKSKGYATSQVIRRRIEELFGWMKTTGGMRKSRYRGVERTHMAGQFCAAASNLLRMAKLSLSGPPQVAVGE